MQIPIVVERVKGNGYRARSGEPVPVSSRGQTREDAIKNLREKIHARLKEGSEIVGLEVGPTLNPWLESAGIFSPKDPLVQEWIQIMAENRRKMDEDPDVL